jgi:hypothetical protein
MSQPLTLDPDVLAYVMVRRNTDGHGEAASACTGMDRADFADTLRRLAKHYDEQPATELRPQGSSA